MEGVMRKGEIKQSQVKLLYYYPYWRGTHPSHTPLRGLATEDLPSILSLRHPHEHGDPSYSERCSSVLALYCSCCWWCGSILSLRHPRERGDPSYSERSGLVLALHYQ